MSDIPEFKIAKLNLGPKDVLVVQVEGHVSHEIFGRVQDHVNRALGGLEIRTLIIDHSIILSVLTRAEIDARSAKPSEEDAA